MTHESVRGALDVFEGLHVEERAGLWVLKLRNGAEVAECHDGVVAALLAAAFPAVDLAMAVCDEVDLMGENVVPSDIHDMSRGVISELEATIEERSQGEQEDE